MDLVRALVLGLALWLTICVIGHLVAFAVANLSPKCDGKPTTYWLPEVACAMVWAAFYLLH